MSGFAGTGSGAITFTVIKSATQPSTCTGGSWSQLGATVALNTGSPNGSYSPTASWKPTSAGTYWWYASWPGNTNNNAANSSCPPVAETIVTDPDAFQVSNPGDQVAGTPFSVTITAQLAAGGTDTSYTGSKTITFTGPASSPNGTAPVYPASVSFTNGVGTATITLYNAASTTLTATQGAITGTTSPPPFQVKAANVQLAFSACPPSDTRKNKSSAEQVSRGNDPYGNADPNVGTPITVTLSSNGGGSWSPGSTSILAGQTASSASSFTSPNSAGVSVTLTAHTTTAGYTDGTCTFTTTN
jgi:hypothetical protein